MVADRGPGIAPAVVASLVDYTAKTSSNAAYVSPTRGQQGNALQTILPMGFALDRVPYAGRGALRATRPRVVHPARLRRRRLLDQADAGHEQPPLHVQAQGQRHRPRAAPRRRGGARPHPERVSFGKESKDALRRRLARNGALPDEIDFLLSGQGQNGQRVELNAMTSDQFVAIVERRLTEHGAAKVVPSADTLAQAFVAFRRGEMAQQALEAELARLNAGPVDIPADLDERVRAYLDEHPEATWDAAVRAIIEEDDDEEDEIGDRP